MPLYVGSASVTALYVGSQAVSSAYAGAAAAYSSTPAAPANVSVPTIDDTTPTVGDVLTASPGAWSGSPAPIFAYQWKRGATNVGTDSPNYTVLAGDVGSTLTVMVTATNASGSASATSAATSAVVAAPVVDTTPPTITSTNAHSVNENAVYNATATANETVTWAKGGTDAGLVTLNTSTGAWSVAAQDRESRASVVFTLTATDTAGNASSPQTVTLTINNVLENTLAALSLSPNTATVGVAYSGTLTGRTAGSTLSLSGTGAAGLSINNTTGAVTGTPTTAGAVNVVETIADATNSPRTSSGAITVTAASAPTAPVVTWSTGPSDNTPEFDIDLTSPQVGDVVTLEISASNTFTSPTTYTDTLDSGEVAAGEVIVTIAALANGTWYARAKVTRASVDSAWSNTASQTIAVDTTAPTLSSPTGTQTGQTTATLGVTTNEANGTLYSFVSTSATPPSAATLKAGTGAAFANNQAITTTGAKTASATGLTASTGYYVHWLHRDAAGNESTIATSAQFTTAAASGYATQLVRFSGTDTDTIGDAALSGGASTTKFTLSFWFRKNGGDGAEQIIHWEGSSTGNVIVRISPTNNLQAYGVGRWEVTSSSTILAGSTVYHALLSVDVAAASVQLYINDVNVATNNNIYNTAAMDLLNNQFFLASDNGGAFQFNGDLGDYWYNPDTWFDLSAASNRRKFIDVSGKPVDLGAAGATPTGSSPLVFLSGPVASWPTNKGTGGGFDSVFGTRGDGGTYS